MKITINIPCEHEVHTCPFCGREFDYEELCRTLKEQGWCGYKSIPVSPPKTLHKYCGLYCSWLGSGNMEGVLRRDGEEKLDRIKNDIASRVAKFLKEKECKCNL